jgi:hypothetical protein
MDNANRNNHHSDETKFLSQANELTGSVSFAQQ